MTVIVGGHSTLGNIRVDRVLQTYKNGVYIAQISVWDSDTNTNQYIAKTNNSEMLMFPATWTADRILVEIDSAYSNQVDDLDAVRQAEGTWAGISHSGVRIEGYRYPEFTAFQVAHRSK
ncbi:TPA: EndoU domain-containing protein [Pasteurella multocida]|nr:EndoU domain-containing protein [Pasteurella multocida]HED4436897.1 EndoU domain-containing protein [Pasteurella multocida]